MHVEPVEDDTFSKAQDIELDQKRITEGFARVT